MTLLVDDSVVTVQLNGMTPDGVRMTHKGSAMDVVSAHARTHAHTHLRERTRCHGRVPAAPIDLCRSRAGRALAG